QLLGVPAHHAGAAGLAAGQAAPDRVAHLVDARAHGLEQGGARLGVVADLVVEHRLRGAARAAGQLVERHGSTSLPAQVPSAGGSAGSVTRSSGPRMTSGRSRSQWM